MGNDYDFIAGGHAVITFEGKGVSDSVGKQQKGSTSTTTAWYPWGADNNLPNELVKIVFANDIKPQLLKNERNFIYGGGLAFCKKEFVDGKEVRRFIDLKTEYPQVYEWYKQNKTKVKKALKRSIYNYVYFKNYFVEFILIKGGPTGRGRTIKSFQVRDCNYMRAELIGDSGNIENYFHSVHFGVEESKAKSNNTKIPAYEEDSPTGKVKFIYHGKDDQPGQPYYPLPEYYGTINWTKLSNKIPLWHDAGIENGYNPRVHIEVNTKYFDTCKDEEEKNAKYQRLKQEIDTFMKSVDGNAKAFISKFESSLDGKEMRYVKITPLKNELSDEAYTKLYEQSTKSNIRGHDIHPTLANVSESGKLSSGSEMRNAFNVHVALKTPMARECVLEFMEVIKEINGWPDELEFWFKDVEIVTTDNNKSGVQEKSEEANETNETE